MAALRGIYRMLAFFLVSAFYVLRAVFLKQGQMRRAMELRMFWARRMINILGIEVELEGKFPEGGHLIISNHRSYIDPAIELKYVLSSAVAKAEVGKWPVIGAGCRASYVILVDRDSKESRKKTRDDMRQLLDNGFSVLIYPEGTTIKGPDIKEFRPGPFQVAEAGGFPIVPVAIEYQNADDAWVDDDTFLGHFYKTFKRKRVGVKVSVGSTIQPGPWETTRQQAEDWVRAEVLRLRGEWDQVTA